MDLVFADQQRPRADSSARVCRSMYAVDGGVRDRLVDFSNPASGSFYFAASVETLDKALA